MTKYLFNDDKSGIIRLLNLRLQIKFGDILLNIFLKMKNFI